MSLSPRSVNGLGEASADAVGGWSPVRWLGATGRDGVMGVAGVSEARVVLRVNRRVEEGSLGRGGGGGKSTDAPGASVGKRTDCD